MAEWRLFDPDSPPEWTTPEWYESREHAPHLEQEPHASRLRVAAELISGISKQITHVVDFGAGDGGLLSLVDRRLVRLGFDLQPTNVRYAIKRRKVSVLRRDVIGDFPVDTMAAAAATRDTTCAVATEMLEHLVDPHGFVRLLHGHARWLVASSPHTETDQSHYAFHTWAWDQAGYGALLTQAGYEVIQHREVDIFQVVLARHRDEESVG